MIRFKVIRVLDASGVLVGFMRRGKIAATHNGATAISSPSAIRVAIARAQHRFPQHSFQLGDWLTGNAIENEEPDGGRMRNLFDKLSVSLSMTASDEVLLEQAIYVIDKCNERKA